MAKASTPKPALKKSDKKVVKKPDPKKNTGGLLFGKGGGKGG